MRATADYVAAYDIADPRRLRQVLKLLLAHAIDRQKSVFEVRLDAVDCERLTAAVSALIDPGQDRFMLLRLSGHRQCEAIGIAPTHIRDDFFIVG